MQVFEAIRKRRSIRRYKKANVEQDKLEMVLEAARLSPSAANMQPWRFVVISKEESREKMRLVYNADWLVQAPVIIVACGIPTEAWTRADGEKYWQVDVSIAMQSLILTATELGLGTCWIANFDEEEARRIIGIPKSWKVLALTPLGYPDEEKGPVRHRKPLKDIVHIF